MNTRNQFSTQNPSTFWGTQLVPWHPRPSGHPRSPQAFVSELDLHFPTAQPRLSQTLSPQTKLRMVEFPEPGNQIPGASTANLSEKSPDAKWISMPRMICQNNRGIQWVVPRKGYRASKRQTHTHPNGFGFSFLRPP